MIEKMLNILQSINGSVSLYKFTRFSSTESTEAQNEELCVIRAPNRNSALKFIASHFWRPEVQNQGVG